MAVTLLGSSSLHSTQMRGGQFLNEDDIAAAEELAELADENEDIAVRRKV